MKERTTSAVIALDGRILAYRRGGIPRYVAALARHLPVVAPELALQVLINRPVDDLPAPTRRVWTPPHHRWERLTLGLELLWLRPRLVHSPDFITPIAPGIRRVVTVHDLAFLDDPGLLAPDAARYYLQLPRTIRDADAVITVSETVRCQVIERLGVPPARVFAVHNGIDDEILSQLPASPAAILRQHLEPDQAAKILDGDPVVLAVGTVEPRKRHTLLIDAVTLLRDREPASAPFLVIVGQPGWQCDEAVAAIGRLVQAGGALWLTDVDDALLAALYQTATLLAMPSRDEGFGLPVVEAMAAGLPTLVANRGALPEVAGDAGLIVEDETAEAWADAIASLIGDAALRQELGQRGMDRAQCFRWERTARETAAVYREVLSS